MGPYAPSGAAEPSAAPEANTPADVPAVPGSAPGWTGRRVIMGWRTDGLRDSFTAEQRWNGCTAGSVWGATFP